MFLLSSIVIVFLFLLCISMPLVSFILPVYKIKKMSTLGIKERLIVNVIAMGILAYLDLMFLLLYVTFFLVIEGLYYYFKNFKNNIGIFDRIFITSIITTAIMGLYSYFIKDDIYSTMKMLKAVYETKFGMSPTEIQRAFNILKDYYIFTLFIYSGIATYFTYYILERNNYKNWEISYKWTILYMIGFFVEKYIKSDIFYGTNILEIGKLIYIIFGIKVIYSMLNQRINLTGINKIVSVIIGGTFPSLTFILGAIKSFNIRIRIIRK
ncbi:hypothetical protein [Cetobacterium sp. SF1]|uniref:hypothetical protein n=1 Tax=unclassified Cetobacterium TaxID=2630983 RepID=UPI003CF42DB3